MKKAVQLFLGLALGLFLFWLLFKDTDWPAVGVALGSASPTWLFLSVVTVLVSFVTRIIRWGYIVRTAGPVGFRAMFSATQIGFLANFTLPGRVGEVVRAVVLSRLTGLTFSRCFAFVALDRVTDLFGLIVVMLITVTVFQPSGAIVIEEFPQPIEPDLIRAGALGMGVAIFCIVAAFVVLYLNKSLALRLVDRILGGFAPRLAVRLGGMLEQFADGMHVFKSVGDMSKAIGWSLVTWGVGIVCYFCVIQAFAIEAPWYTAVVIMAFLAVAISIPSTPGFLGPFHLGIFVAVLVVAPETDRDVLRATVIIAHLFQLLPVLVVGCLCLYLEGFGLMELGRQGEELEEGAAEKETLS